MLKQEQSQSNQNKRKNKRKIEYSEKLNFTKYDFDYLMEYAGFTLREKKIFKLRQFGKTNTDISIILDVSLSTVNKEIKKIKKKIIKTIEQYEFID